MKMSDPRCKPARIYYTIILVLISLSFFSFTPVAAEDCTDEGVKKGVKLYDDVKFDAAIQELKNAIKKPQGGRGEESKRACSFKANIFIGLAYLGKRNEKEAKKYFINACKT